MRRPWLFLLPLSIGLSLLIPLLYGGSASIAHLQRVPWWGFLVLLGMVALGWLFNAARVKLLTHSLGLPMVAATSLRTVIASEFAGVATPVNAGEPATYAYLFSKHGFSIGRGFAIVAVDKSMDLIFFATAGPIALLFFAASSGVGHPLRFLGLMVLIIVVGLAALTWLLGNYRRVALGLGRLMHHKPRLRKTRYRLARWLIQFRQSMTLLWSVRKSRLALLYLFCAAHWITRYSILAVLLWIIGEPTPWLYLFVVQILLMFAGHATFLPGGVGGVEIGFTALLRPYLDPATTAAALLLWRFFTFYSYLLLGAPVFVIATGRQATDLMAIGKGDKQKPA